LTPKGIDQETIEKLKNAYPHDPKDPNPYDF